jgi:hypothetical protein
MDLFIIAMMDDFSTLHVASYNCRGYNELKRFYIKSLLHSSEAAVMLLQEHWLSADQLQQLGNVDANYLYTGVSGFDNSEILTGRPFGGCADFVEIGFGS